MNSPDADKWNSRYRDAPTPNELRPPQIVIEHLDDLSPAASVLDVASGWGDAGLFLATHGAVVTLADVSTVALRASAERANGLSVDVTTSVVDLTVEPIPTSSAPSGTWDVILCTHYLDRALLPRLGEALAPGGRLVCAIATVTNLERHERPSARFLLEAGELATLVPDLDVVHASEAWRANGVHEAWLVATSNRELDSREVDSTV